MDASELGNRHAIHPVRIAHLVVEAGGRLIIERPSDQLVMSLIDMQRMFDVHTQIFPRDHACVVTTDRTLDQVRLEVFAPGDLATERAAPLPVTSDPSAPVIRSLTVRSGKLSMHAELRDRAKRIIQAIIDEAGRRGWLVAPVAGTEALEIQTGFFVAGLMITEDVPRPPGRLKLAMTRGDLWHGDARYWADRSKHDLEERLGAAFVTLEYLAEVTNRRMAEIAYFQQQIDDMWNRRLDVARRRCLDAKIDAKLAAEMHSFAEAEQLRRYAQQIESTRPELSQWIDAIRKRADGIDPILAERDLGVDETSLKPAEIAAFLPEGMAGTTPPTIREWFDMAIFGGKIRRVARTPTTGASEMGLWSAS